VTHGRCELTGPGKDGWFLRALFSLDSRFSIDLCALEALVASGARSKACGAIKVV